MEALSVLLVLPSRLITVCTYVHRDDVRHGGKGGQAGTNFLKSGRVGVFVGLMMLLDVFNIYNVLLQGGSYMAATAEAEEVAKL